MIEPTPSDIGRLVVKTDHGDPRKGKLMRFTADWCFVKFQGENFARPEAREALEWLRPK